MEPTEEEDTGVQWWMIVLLFVFQLLSSFFNGLNIGIMGLETSYLEFLMAGPHLTEEEKENGKKAKRILPLRKRTNWTLSTILLGVASTNALVSIFTADLIGEIPGFVVSTTSIVLLGEIIPQAFFNRYALTLSAASVYVAYVAMVLFAPIAWPFAKILDLILGPEEDQVLSKTQLKKLFTIQEQESILQPEERKILSTTLEFKKKNARWCMTPLEKVFMLEVNSLLDSQLLKEIYYAGHTRIPVYEKDRENIIGFFMARDLMMLMSENNLYTIKQLSTLLVRPVILLDHQLNLEPILGYFKNSEDQFGVVTRLHQDKDGQKFKKIGIITLEDIIEALLEEQIHDERDTTNLEGQKLRAKLYMLFTDHRAENMLTQVEIKGVCDYLSSNVSLFFRTKMKPNYLEQLVRMSEVFEIESDELLVSEREHDSFVPSESDSSMRRKESHERKSDQPTNTINSKIDFPKSFQRQRTFTPGGMEEIECVTPTSMKRKNSVFESKEIQLVQDKSFINMPFPERFLRKDTLKYYASNLGGSVLNKVHSRTNSDMGSIPEEDLYAEMKKQHHNEKEQKIIEEDHSSPVLYQRKVASDEFVLILAGNVAVKSGESHFLVELSTFNYMGVEALSQKQYTPDFTAQVNKYAKILIIKRMDYLKMLSSLQNYV